MTRATGYLGKREFHGALATHSVYRIKPTMCVVCSRKFDASTLIVREICFTCRGLGWYSPGDPQAPAVASSPSLG